MDTFKYQLHQAGNKIGNIKNSERGAQFIGNFNVGGNISVQTYEKSTEERLLECRRALRINCTDPHDDRDKIVAVKTQNGHIISASCEWITANSLYRSWEDPRSKSQLLWISSAEERGKTMMAIYLSMELEKAANHNNNTVLYFFLDRQDKRDTAVHVLRGLLIRLLQTKRDLTHHLLEEYEVQREALFSKDAIEALWRVFVKMIADPIAGQVSCIIDGLDCCTDDSLRRLISRITNFFREEPRAPDDNGSGASPYTPYSAGRSSEQRRTEQRQAAGLKMLLVSRDKPDWMVERLYDTRRIDIGVRGRRSGTAARSTPKSARPPPTLASVAASVMHQQRLDRQRNMIQPNSPTESQLLTRYNSLSPNHAQQSLSIPVPPPDSTLNSTFSPQVEPPAPQAPEMSHQQAIVSGTYRQTFGLDNTTSNGSHTSPTGDIQANNLSPLPSVQASLNGHNTSHPTLPQSVIPQCPNVSPPYQYKEENAGVFNDAKTEAAMTEEESGDPALRLYIEAKLEEICAERQYTIQDQSYIIAALEHRGDDTFLWVDFAIEEIRKSTSPSMETVVNSIPPTLTEMYSFILLGIPGNLIDIVAGLLQWTVCAREPLTILDLTVTLGLTHHGIVAAENIVRTAIKACGNMLTENPKDKSVNIVHHSIVDYLTDGLSPMRADTRLTRFAVHSAQAHSNIANFCISYLEAGCLHAGPVSLKGDKDAYIQRITQFPFMTYAASFWPHHFRDAGTPYLNLSSPFFQSKSKIRKNWWITYWSFSTGKSKWTAPRDFTLLHLCSYVDLVCVAQQMLHRGDLKPRIDKRDSHGWTALEYSVVRGHIDIFRFLVGNGASQKGLDENLLELACRMGQQDIAEELIKMGYNVDVRAQTTSIKESAFMMARWLPGVVDQGLDLSADIWSYYLLRDIGQEETPLAKAAMFGHSAVVELLLNHGANVNAGTTKLFTPLHAASYQGQTECVEILNKRGANAMAQTIEQWLPFHFAAVRGKLEVVELFLDMGVPLEAMTIKQKTALHLAAYSGHADVVRTLLNRRANLNLRSYKGETPLHLATRNFKPQIVELLLSFGATRDVVDNEGKTPLNLVENATGPNAKECLRILQTFGMPGYQEWQPPAATSTTATADDASEVSLGDTAASRRDSAAWSPTPNQRPFAPMAAPGSYPIQGVQAEFSFSGQYQTSRTPGPYAPGSTRQEPMYSPTGQHVPIQATHQGFPPVQQPSLHRVQSEPTHSPPRFTYDPNATFQNYQPQQSDAPPPYNQAAEQRTYQTPAYYQEKGPSFVAPNDMSQNAWQRSTPVQTCNDASAATMPSQSFYSTPAPENSSECQQPTQTSVVQMINAMSLNSHPTPVIPSVSNVQPVTSQSTAFAMPSHVEANHSTARNPTFFVPTTQTPVTPMSPPPHSATAPAVLPFQPPPIQPTHIMQPQQNPQHHFAQHRSQTVPIAQAPHQYQQAQHPHLPVYPPTYGVPAQQVYSSPLQSPQFSGNTTASTYNATYEYSAPAVTQPYNPGLGVNPNGLLFAPPPQNHSLGKRKSFLGGLLK
ncbi:hypothetical protein E8E13_010284 [Curvularia kusanoi]|uniref:Nephrocystin 3-like N-terminal domain-containing protein n=1 Tax=Curvularia kusanoi TaxID=90978 RepID=A0A9P4W801_CURKU|nr:hypothetical protein E8E13_010284 [Curvularia kusanoi]